MIAILCDFVRFCAILCDFVRFCAILCDFVRFCAILCDFVRFSPILGGKKWHISRKTMLRSIFFCKKASSNLRKNTIFSPFFVKNIFKIITSVSATSTAPKDFWP
jgi:hypothetical protein